MTILKMETSALITYLLVMLFGSSSWMSVNGAWIELPLLVPVLPEGWSLPSHMVVVIQVAFIGPFIYTIVKHFLTRSTKNRKFASIGKNFTPTPLIYASLVIAVLCHLLLAIFWDRTSYVGGSNRSTALLALFFFMSMMNSLSNVLYLPYMFRFRPTYTTAYFIGMGFSALVPSVLGLIQGSGHIECVQVSRPFNNSTDANETKMEERSIPPRFGVGVFNGIICIWLSMVIVGFYFLNRLPQLQKERDEKLVEGEKLAEQEIDKGAKNAETRRLSDGRSDAIEGMTESKPERRTDTLTKKFYIFLLAVTAWVCALMMGVLPSIQSFATLPYGQLTYHLAVTISNLANPLACMVPFIIKVRRVGLYVTVWTIVGTLLAAYIMATAVYSPTPLLGRGSGTVGPAFSVITWTLVTGILAYLRTLVAGYLREANGGEHSDNRLFYYGFISQLGSFISAWIMFPLINNLEIFKTAPRCAL